MSSVTFGHSAATVPHFGSFPAAGQAATGPAAPAIGASPATGVGFTQGANLSAAPGGAGGAGSATGSKPTALKFGFVDGGLITGPLLFCGCILPLALITLPLLLLRFGGKTLGSLGKNLKALFQKKPPVQPAPMPAQLVLTHPAHPSGQRGINGLY